MYEVTIFKNIKDTSTPFHRSVDIMLERIKDGSSKDLIVAIRKEKDKDKRNQLKQDLPAICFSGTFNKRSDDSLINHSGLICLDFDGFKTKSALQAKKDEMAKDLYTFSVFVSPSGNGIKVLVKIPSEGSSHKSFFKALQKYYDCDEFDITCKNVSRVCYESFDPKIYINEDSEIWTEEDEEELVSYTHESRATLKLTDTDETIKRLRLWWEKDYGMIPKQRNNNLFVLAKTLCEFGVDKSDAAFIILDYDPNPKNKVENKNTIDSAYKNLSIFGTKWFEDTQTLNLVKQKMSKGLSKKQVRSFLKESGVENAEAIESVINRIEEDSSHHVYWEKSKNGAVSVVHWKFKKFLEDHGYYKYAPEGSKSYLFVKVTNNLIEPTSEEQIKDFVLDYLKELDDYSVYNYFADKTRLFKEDFLSFLGCVNVHFMSDTKEVAYIYYQNCAVKITQDEISTIDYIDLPGFVWKDHCCPRNFEVVSDTKCDFRVFMLNICGKDLGRFDSLKSTVGYLLHGYKNLGYSPAVILNDELISDHPEGGTGKGLFVNGISQLKKVVTIDGKAFTFERNFAYQLVSADTQIICFDDIRKGFSFERLFSIITEGITVEKKNKDAIKIPFERSPKVVLTTNYAVRGKGSSYERRKWELELSQHYSQNHTPEMDFGRLFFGDWDKEEWLRFDNFMIECLQGYLQTGLVKCAWKNLIVRKFRQETDDSFHDWITDKHNEVMAWNTTLQMNELWTNFIEENPDFGAYGKLKVSNKEFYSWLRSFALFETGKEATEGRNSQGKYIIFHKDDVPYIEQF